MYWLDFATKSTEESGKMKLRYGLTAFDVIHSSKRLSLVEANTMGDRK